MTECLAENVPQMPGDPRPHAVPPPFIRSSHGKRSTKKAVLKNFTIFM